MQPAVVPAKNEQSLSARRAWIEMPLAGRTIAGAAVALRKESVDRNWIERMPLSIPLVALRKESVDRNTFCARSAGSERVALRKESVDRNIFIRSFMLFFALSLSARRAWIEIKYSFFIFIRSCRSPQGERG